MTEAPPLPWRPQRNARRAALDLDRIVAAALAVLDAEGVDALSMRRLANELGVSAALLYHYVTDKDELLDLVLDEVLSEVPLERSADWRHDLQQLAGNIHAALTSHRDVARIAITRVVPSGHHGLRVAEALLDCLRRAGLPDDHLSYAADATSALVQGFAIEHSLDLDKHLPGQGSIDERLRAVGDYFASLPASSFPVIRSVGATMGEGSPAARFQFALDLLVRGIAAMGEPV